MSKLWKRLVMLGALVGCMATAAWAQEDSSWQNFGEYWTGNQRNAMEADGFYRTGDCTLTADGSKYNEDTYKTYFNSNGDVMLEIQLSEFESYSVDTITRYEYDDNGNLVKKIYASKDAEAAIIERRGLSNMMITGAYPRSTMTGM